MDPSHHASAGRAPPQTLLKLSPETTRSATLCDRTSSTSQTPSRAWVRPFALLLKGQFFFEAADDETRAIELN